MTRPSWVVGAVLLVASGCSFALSGPDPKQPRGQEPKCDTEKTAVLGDGLLATAAGITTLAVGADSGGAAILPAVIGAVLVGAAIHGNNVVNDCRTAKAEYIASLQAPPPPPIRDGDDSDERAASAQRARLIRSPASTTATFAPPLGPPPAAAAPADAPDSPPPPVPASAAPAPAPAATAPPPPPPPANPAPAPTWSAFWKEVH